MVKKVIGGSDAVAWAVRLSRAKVLAVYPITPQTIILERLAKWIADGEYDAELVRVESEHSALSAIVGAQATGVRTFTATNSQGLMLMSEIMYIASGLRLPIVMVVTNRALSAPINIWNDHSDAMAVRDSSWIQLFVENAQEALDTVIQAYKIAEDWDVLLPTIVNMDGFILTHSYEVVDIPTQEEVDKFLPEYKPRYKLDPEKPITVGPVGAPNSYMEFKYEQAKAMKNAEKKIKEVNEEYGKIFGRKYGNGLVELFNINEKTKKVLVAMGSICGTIKDWIKKKNKNIGLIRVRAFRPFPFKDIMEVLSKYGIEEIGVIDRAFSYGSRGPLYLEILTGLYEEDVRDLKVTNFIVGLGGRLVKYEDLEVIEKKLGENKKIYWINVFNEPYREL